MKKIILSLLAAVLCGLGASAQRFQLPDASKAPGEIRVLCIGNSFTYVHDTDVMLRQIAQSQGVNIQIGKFLAGGYTFGGHLKNENSRKAVEFGGYDIAFLQDQSSNPARYARDKDRQVYDDFKALKENVKAYSPDCKVFLERTWGYSGSENAQGFGTCENLDKYLKKGTRKMARKAHTKISPIGAAFVKASAQRPDIKLLGTDDHHQSLEGAYLKACVNYLVITRRPFSGEVDCCGVDPETAAFLRKVAGRTVLGK
ncbi:MAG: hypothetical protein IJ205_03935 [Bacteroidales bacterium]|nr:hypothetical protein [Bacteroidales bacterium]